MSFLYSKEKGIKISTRNLLRLELFIGFLVVNFFANALNEFGFEGYSKSIGFIMSSFYLALLIISFGFEFSNRFLKRGILSLYWFSVTIVLLVAVQYDFDEIHYLSFLFVYAFFSFSQDNIKFFIAISGFLFLLMIGSAIWLESIVISSVLLILSFLLIFTTGAAITFSRYFLKNKLLKRQKLLNDIFNISPEGLVLLNIKKGTLEEYNIKFKELFESEESDKLTGSNYNLIRIGDKHLFRNIDFERAVSIELRDGRILNMKFQKVEVKREEMVLGTIKAYKNRDELNKSYEFDRLLSLSEESYKYLFEDSSSLICILDRDGKILDVNQTTTDLSAISKEEFIGKSFDFIDFEKADINERFLRNQRAWNGEKQVLEKAIKGKNGERIELEVIIQKGKYFGDDVLICNSRNINERKALERELVRNYDKFVALFELSPIGIMVSDLEGNIIDYNSSFLDLLEIDKIKANKLRIEDISHPDDLEKQIETRNRILQNNLISEEIKKRFVTQTGREIHTLLNIVLQNNSEGSPAVFISQLINITDIVAGQSLLEESEISYRNLFNNSSDLIYLLDEEKNFVDINNAVLQQYGYSKEELMSYGPEILFAPGKNDLEDMGLKAQKAMETGEEMSVLFWSKKKSGEIFPKEMKIKPSQYRGKTVMMVRGRDVSQSHKFQEELQRKEKRYRDLFERNLAGVYRTNKEGKILECNQAFARIFGYNSPDEMKHKMNAKNFYQNAIERESLIERLEQINHVEGWQVKLRKKMGEKITALVNVSKIPGEDFEYYEGNLIDISELTKTQEQLRLSQKKYQQLIDNSSFGIVIANQEKEIIFSNLKAGDILEYKVAEELIDMSIFEISNPKGKSFFESLFEEKNDLVLNEPKDVYLLKSDGREIEVELTPSSILFEDEYAIQLSFVDISDRKRAERAQEKAKVAETFNKILQAELKEKEKTQKKLIDAQSYMEGIIESSLDMIFTTDLEGRINKLNSAAQKELKVEQEDILNKPLKFIFHKNEDADRIFDKLEQKNSFSGEVDLIRSDKSVFLNYFSLSYLYNAEGVRLGIMGVSRDISEIKAKEIEINQQAAKLNAVIESSSHFFFTINRKYEITSYNHVFESDLIKNMGFQLDGINNFFDIIPYSSPEEKSELEKYWKKKFEKTFQGKSTNFEIKRKDLNGEVYYRDFYLNPIYLKSQKVDEISGIGHDITQKKISEQDLKNSLKEKEVLLKEVHHRVKNNMQVISSILSLQSSYIEDEKVLGILRESQNRIKSMAFIHERLYRTKDFSQLKFSEYIKNLTESLVSTYDTTNKEIDIEFDLDEVFLNLDSAIPCGLILNELISNSLKYAFVGRKSGKIKVLLKEKDGSEYTLSIYDNGVGIPEGINIEKTETLGLQLVQTLTEQLEGTIEMQSGEGSKFDLTFSKKD